MRRLPLLLGLIAPVVILAGNARAQDAAAAYRKHVDSRVGAGVVNTLRVGVELYNAGDAAGCYRVYQGALTGLAPTLDYRPEWKTLVETSLRDAERLPDYQQRAFALRKVLDQIYNGTRTLWDRLGGEPAVKAVVHDFVAKAAANPKVDFTRGGKYPIDAAGVANLEKLLVDLVSATTGGPRKYTGRDMKSSHQGMAISEAEFGAIAGDLIATLQKYKVPQKEIDELVAIVASTKPDIVEGAAAPATDDKPLWDRLGGEPAVKAVVHDFVALAANNPDVDFTRGGKYALDADGVAKLETLLVEFVSAASGGPLKYSGRDMKTSHEGMAITEAQFNAIAGDLVTVLKKYKVPQKEIDELVGAVAGTKGDIVEDK